MRARIFGTLAVVCLLAMLVSPGVAQRGVTTERVAVDLNLRPGDAEGTFVLTARVKDLGTELVLAAPHIVFGLGDEAHSSSRLPTGEEIRLRVWVPETRNEVELVAEILRRGEVVFSSNSRIRMAS